MVILDLLEAVQPLADGASTRVRLSSAGEAELVRTWCDRSGNTLVAVSDDWVEVRRGRTSTLQADVLDRLPARLWLYTNFDCNLACDYCCVRSSPRTPRRALDLERIRRLVGEAPTAGVTEIYLTGGEPFILPEIGDIVAICVAAMPTTLLTNGMLFQRGPRLEVLRQLPRGGFALQISLDSPTPDIHDRHRGPGSWKKAIDGIRLAQDEGFRVRTATTLTEDGPDEPSMRTFLDRLGVPREDQVVRQVARRGLALKGVVLTTESLIPEITVTADGVYWHPVAADDEDMLITRTPFPLTEAVDKVRALFFEQQRKADAIAEAFVCA
jgi:pyruvate-formate lyase-activating enzyme